MRKCIYCNKYYLTSFVECPHCGGMGNLSNQPPADNVIKNRGNEKCRLCDVVGWKGGVNCHSCENNQS